MFSIQSVLCLDSEYVSYWQSVEPKGRNALNDHSENSWRHGGPNVYKEAIKPLRKVQHQHHSLAHLS